MHHALGVQRIGWRGTVDPVWTFLDSGIRARLVATEESGVAVVDRLGRYTVYLVLGFVVLAALLRIRSAVVRRNIRKELDAPPPNIFPEELPAPQFDLPAPNVELDADPFA